MDLDEKEELLFSWKFMLSRQYSTLISQKEVEFQS